MNIKVRTWLLAATTVMTLTGVVAVDFATRPLTVQAGMHGAGVTSTMTAEAMTAETIRAGIALGAVSADGAAAAELRRQAIEAVRVGKFIEGNESLQKAVGLSDDAQLKSMADLVASLASQMTEFSADRRKEFDKRIEDLKKVQEAGLDSFKVDFLAQAHVRSADRSAFIAEPWVRELMEDAAKQAHAAKAAEDWGRAQRMFADLASLEPYNPEWEREVRDTTRRIRILLSYAPKAFRQQRAAEEAEAKRLLEVIAPDKAAEAATRPAPKEDDDADSPFKYDWQDRTRGIKLDMLWGAMVDTRTNFWKDVNYKILVEAGMEGARALATTKGLETTFAGLGDEVKRTAFLNRLNELDQEMKAAPDSREQIVARQILSKLMMANDDTVALPREVLIAEVADAALGKLDPVMAMTWPADLEEFNKSTQGEFSGVGIVIDTTDDGWLMVVSPIEDSPAFKAGLKAGDHITRINGKDAKGISTTQAVKTITGPKGTQVTLTVKSADGATTDHTLTRTTVKVASVKGVQHLPGGGWNWMLDPASKVAYVRLTEFTRQTAEELRQASKEFTAQGATALILDLRYNRGGLLSAATEVSDKFLTEGVIVSTRADRVTPQPPTVATAKNDGDELSIPTVVLVNQFSASASEIVSGALKDHRRAMVIGERSFGKGSVQITFPSLERNALARVTTYHYYLPAGKCIHREEGAKEWGVEPDIKIEMTPEQMRKSQQALRELDVLRASGEPATQPAGGEISELLKSDPQLSTALTMLKLQLAGAPVMPEGQALAAGETAVKPVR